MCERECVRVGKVECVCVCVCEYVVGGYGVCMCECEWEIERERMRVWSGGIKLGCVSACMCMQSPSGKVVI